MWTNFIIFLSQVIFKNIPGPWLHGTVTLWNFISWDISCPFWVIEKWVCWWVVDTYPVLGETFAHRTICPFNRVVISASLQFLQQLPIDNKSDAGMSQRRTAEPDCSAVVAFSSLWQYIISPINEILVALSAWSTLQISSWTVSSQRGKSCGSSDQVPFLWPPLTASIFLCLRRCVFSLA